MALSNTEISQNASFGLVVSREEFPKIRTVEIKDVRVSLDEGLCYENKLTESCAEDLCTADVLTELPATTCL